jgi:uncharacterized protein YbjT (DUF2867 family)
MSGSAGIMKESPMSQRILVTGSTGKTGGELLKLLVHKGLAVRAATRNPSALPSRLPSSAEVVEFDFERPETFAPALEGIGRMFLIARPGDNHADEVAAPLIDTARKANIDFIVNVTAVGVEQDETFMLRKLERCIEASGIPCAHLRPNWFMQNFNSGSMLADIRRTAALHLPADDARISFIDVRDIAAAAFAVLTQSHHAGKAYTLTGNEALNHFQVVEKISRVAGKTISYVPISEATARSGLAASGVPAELIDRWAEFYRKIRIGFCSPVSRDVNLLLGRPPISFDQYASDHAVAWQ